MTVFELVWRANINDGGFAVGDDLGGFVGFHMFDGVCGEHKGGDKQEEGGEESFHENGEFQFSG